MKKTGYVIAKNKGLSEFFTSSSAYDRPRWVSLAEATTYPTADMAQNASTKLYKSSGSYEARFVSIQDLTEARGRDMSYTEQPYDDSDESGILPDDEVGGNDAPEDDKMVARIQGSDPSIDTEADDEMGLADEDRPENDEDAADIEDMVDQRLGNEDDDMPPEDDDMPPEDDGTVGMPGEDDDIEGAPDIGFDEDLPAESEETAFLRPEEARMMRGNRGVTESATKSVPEIKFKNPISAASKPDTDLTTSGAQAHEEKVKVPTNVTSDLKAAIAEFEKTAKFANTRDDIKATFCLTVVEAFKELLDLINLGTVESIKLAQIHMAGLMNPISTHLPTSVVKFVLMGGRKPTLKDLFDNKREDKKGS